MMERYGSQVLAGPEREASWQAAPDSGGIVIPVSATNTPSEGTESAAKFGETHAADPVGGLLAGFDSRSPKTASDPTGRLVAGFARPLTVNYTTGATVSGDLTVILGEDLQATPTTTAGIFEQSSLFNPTLTATPTPEPASLAFLAIGLLGVMAIKRRKCQA